ncbi:MAG: GntR family transcriptional regulator [Spirochaetaceae bacterium]
MKFEEIVVKKPSDLIVDKIWKKILSAELKPGDKLPSERELVKIFNVSSVTVREALNILETNGQIQKKRGAHGGSIILETTPASGISQIMNFFEKNQYTIKQLEEFILSVYPQMASESAINITDKQINYISSILKNHKLKIEETGISELALEYGTYVGYTTKNPIYMVINELFNKMLRELETKSGLNSLNPKKQDTKYYKDCYVQYKKIANGLSTKDPSIAGENTKEALIEIFKLLNNYISDNC